MSDTLAVLQAALTGRYRLDRLVGQGGMGVVYLAHDLKHDRAVAIKVLRPEVAALLGRERFLREIGIAAQLSHPHIVPLYDSGEAEGHLYYVMPHVSGETLRDRLDRDGRLPVDEALRITGHVVAALAHAHGRGVIHRDIKPTNILLSEGFALVADFGLARALSGVGRSEEISSIGLPIGTPRYMSPEQSVGSPQVDGRSDLYSLGCVLHEMLVGASPRELATVAGGEPARLTTLRPEIPAAVERAIARCLAPAPADRYGSVQELLVGLEQPIPPAAKRRQLATAAILAAAAVGIWALVRVIGPGRSFTGGATLDTTRIAVLPFERVAGAPAFQAELPVRAALGRWSGLGVVGGLEVSEALKREGSAPLDRNAANRIARRLGAGRFVRGQLVPFGDSVQVEAVLYATREGTALVQKTARLPLDLAGADSVVPSLVDSLLFQGALPEERFAAPPGTKSLAAMWQFIAGRNAVAGWDLAAADSGFARALAADPGFSRAALWLAQVRVWRGQPAVTWRAAAAQAVAGAARLGARDIALAGLVAAMSRGEYGTACPRWLELTRTWPGEFPVWYGAATCLGRDTGVERDPASPTGWRFRSSYHQAQRAWRQAFALLPAIYRDYRAGGLRGPGWLLWTQPGRGRSGSAIPPDTGLFGSRPTWQGDTLAFLPRRALEFSSGQAGLGGSTTEAVTQQRLAFYDLATEWASTDPQSLEAREAVALALWSLGNASAIDSIRATRAYARSPADRARLGVSEALMRILRGAEDTAELSEARIVTDSVLAMNSDLPGVDPLDFATAAALTGRAKLAARFIRRASPRYAWRLPPALTADALAFLVFAALGGPTDSLVELERRVAEGIATGVDAGRRAAEQGEWLGRPLALAPFELGLPSIARLVGTGDYLIDASAAQAKGDTTTARRLLRRAAASRSGMPASDMMFEALLPEARLLAAMGDAAAAVGRLDPTLATLRRVSLPGVSDPVGAGLLVRAMALRADLAMAMRDSANARRWGRAVAVLWSSSDPFLAPVVERARRASRGTTP